MKIALDKWQIDVKAAQGNIIVRKGRQVGASTIISQIAAEKALKSKMMIMIIAAVEREALLIFEKILGYVHEVAPGMIKKKGDKPTKHRLRLTNGSQILCVPAGITGAGIRGHTIDLLIADEAAFIPEAVWAAVTPSLMTTGGYMILLSTPHGKEGYFYERFGDEDFTSFYVNAEIAVRERTICATWTVKQRDQAIRHQQAEKRRLTDLQYQQEYLGKFIEDLTQFYPDELIIECQKSIRRQNIMKDRDYYIGVDVAHMGDDLSTFEILDLTHKTDVVQVENIFKEKIRTTETTQIIINLNERYDFKKINVDGRGVGAGVVDQLLVNDETKRAVVNIDNASKALDTDKERRKLMKEDLHMNLKSMMERGEISFLKDDSIFHSLKSIQCEKLDSGAITIHGKDDHIAEGLTRGAWGVKQKGLNPYFIF